MDVKHEDVLAEPPVVSNDVDDTTSEENVTPEENVSLKTEDINENNSEKIKHTLTKEHEIFKEKLVENPTLLNKQAILLKKLGIDPEKEEDLDPEKMNTIMMKLLSDSDLMKEQMDIFQELTDD